MQTTPPLPFALVEQAAGWARECATAVNAR
jgi:hypothetical protein